MWLQLARRLASPSHSISCASSAHADDTELPHAVAEGRLQPVQAICLVALRGTNSVCTPSLHFRQMLSLAASCVGEGCSGKRCGSSLLASSQAQATPYLAPPAPMRMIRAWLLVTDFYSPPSTHIAIICAPPPILADIAQTLQQSTHSHPFPHPCFCVLMREAQWVSYPLRCAFIGAPCAHSGFTDVRSWSLISAPLFHPTFRCWQPLSPCFAHP